MGRQDIVDWEAAAGRIEAEGRAPSAVAELRELWARRAPDLQSLTRLVRLEHRFGSAVLAMDLACWTLDAVADSPEVRILAASAAVKAGLFTTARRLLRPLLDGHRDRALAKSVMIAWRDQALASGRAVDIMQVLLIAPANAAGLMRLADERWNAKQQDAALTAYRWAICCGSVATKACLRLSSSALAGGRPGVMIEALQAMSCRTADAVVKARLLVMLRHADRRSESLALLADGAGEPSDLDDVRETQAVLVAYAQAQLEAVAAQEMAPDMAVSEAETGERWSPRQRSHQIAGRALAAAGWHDAAIWQLRRAVDGTETL